MREVEGHIPALRRYARGLIGNEAPDPAAQADELVRETVALAQRNGQLGAFQDPRLWLYATLTVRNRARSAAAPAPSPARPAGHPLAANPSDALGRLALEEREALLLVVVEGFTYAQTASILGLSRPGVATRLCKARQQMAAGAKASPRSQAGRRPGHPPYLRLVK